MSASSTRLPTPEGPGSVSGAPHLPAGFTDTFTSRYVDTGALRQHAVTGGDGPPLLLVHGWPQTWYAWRLLLPRWPATSRSSRSTSAASGGPTSPRRRRRRHPRRRPGRADGRARPPALRRVGHDTGLIIGYALAADHPDRVDRVAVVEVPGPPGVAPAPPRFVPGPVNDRLWHIPVNRVNDELPEQLVRGREGVFFGYEFAIQGGKLPDDVVSYYVGLLASDPDVLRGSFAFYRALDASVAQNEQRKTRRLALPVLAIGGAAGYGHDVGDAMQLAADDVQSLVIPGGGTGPPSRRPRSWRRR